MHRVFAPKTRLRKRDNEAEIERQRLRERLRRENEGERLKRMTEGDWREINGKRLRKTSILVEDPTRSKPK